MIIITYINTDNKKVYITADKSNIVVEADGTLKYNGNKAYAEYKSSTGLKAIQKSKALKIINF